MKAYLDIIDHILKDGTLKENRTGVDSISVSGVMFRHEMKDGFPLLTTKNIPLRLVASELEFFIKGLTDKEWLKERNNHIWDEWCNPERVPYGHSEETKAKMMQERELGAIYGWQWRHFGAEYKGYDFDYTGEGVDQLKQVVDKLKSNPLDRRMIVSAWNPQDTKQMALPPCHYGFQVLSDGKKLDLIWNQRSIDSALGLPFNIASYGLLLHLLAKEANLEEGTLVGFLADTHIYINHREGLEKQLSREPYELPKIKTENFTSIYGWEYTDSKVENYKHHPTIKFEIAV